MKIRIEHPEGQKETLVTVCCGQSGDLETEALLRYLEKCTLSLSGVKDKRTYRIQAGDLFYVECVDEKSFLYGEKDVWESPLRLYQLEEKLQNTGFVRVGKSTLLNIDRLHSVRPLLNGKIEAQMENGEKIMVNRHYVADFRKKFGL